MQDISSADLLNAWEQGLNQPLLQRALILLVATHPERQANELMQLSIGQRDLYLLQLRERLFGQRLLNTATCPQCNERIEWENKTTDFIADTVADDNTVKTFELTTKDSTLHFRLPNSLDMAAIANIKNTEQAQQQLVSRCLLEHAFASEDYAPTQLPPTIIQGFSEQIEHLDPQADIRIQLNCPACQHRWDVLFDVPRFLWMEIHDWAQQMLQTVCKLATAYGWSEREILALSPVRRQLYLGMLG